MSFGKSNNTFSQDRIQSFVDLAQKDTDANHFKFAGKWNKTKENVFVI